MDYRKYIIANSSVQTVKYKLEKLHYFKGISNRGNTVG